MPDNLTQISNQQLQLFNNLIDFGKIVLPSLFTLLAAILGARVGYRFAIKRLKLEKKIDFIHQQVTKFYSPLVGCRMRIRGSSELRVELSGACGTAWKKICKEQPTPFLDHEKHFEPFKKQIEDENQRFPKYLLPLYDQMVDIFTKNYWLAENSTKRSSSNNQLHLIAGTEPIWNICCFCKFITFLVVFRYAPASSELKRCAE